MPAERIKWSETGDPDTWDIEIPPEVYEAFMELWHQSMICLRNDPGYKLYGWSEYRGR